MWADLEQCLQACADEFNRLATKTFGYTIRLSVVKVPAQDVLAIPVGRTEAAPTTFQAQILSGSFDLVVITPSSPSHSRATLGIAQGPNPVRDFFYPRGYPRLSPALRERADEGNHICDAAVEAMQAAAEFGCLSVLDFPEDLGATRRGIPASIWQREELK